MTRSFGGTLVLAGHYDTSPVWREHLFHDGQFVHGDLRTGDVKLDVPVANPIAVVGQDLTMKPFAFVAGGDPYYAAPIPTRGATICVWSHGPQTIVNDAVRLLLNINREVLQVNYAELVQRRVFDQMPGHWTMALCYFGRQSKVLLSARGQALYLWLTYFNGVYTLTYSTDPMHMERAKAYVPEHMANDLFYQSLVLNDATLAVHPHYLVSKFSKHLKEAPGPANRLTVISFMKNYLERTMTPFAKAQA